MTAALIGIDWGTSSRRAYLLGAGGTILARREAAQGILAIADGAFADALAAVTAGWPHGLPILLSGMIGSRQGWIEAPYVATPAGLAELAAKLTAVNTGGAAVVAIIPGLRTEDAHGRPDVLRGEETQVMGALAVLGRGDGLFLLPGTHSKWLRVADGRIQSFATYMTGEVFAALRNHTILGRLMTAEAGNEAGFRAGVVASGDAPGAGDLLHMLFTVRTLGLFDKVPADALADYLSGLLIGAEIRAASGAGAEQVTLIGAADLCARYRRAGEILGLSFIEAPGDSAALGATAIARAAGMI